MSSDDPSSLDPATQLAVIALARRRGLRPEKLSRTEYMALALEIRPLKQIAQDGLKAVTSIVATTLHIRNTSPETAAANKKKCEANTCGAFGYINDGRTPVCHACNCQGMGLESKWNDRKEFCPKELWDNRTLRLPVLRNG